ncbi:ATP-binding protein [Methylocapsa sp. S129]|uniref:hybrid sensor histidine kinase/response regulator n=1 Tax=Methylocapsa sp. S129 TaxID=1641869 RepID=UPI00131D7851|nr:ATP-binding protein [Methylocapsa sp. S129]
MFAEQIAALYRIAPTGIVGAVIAAFVLAGVVVQLGGISISIRAIWLACLTVAAISHLLVCYAYWRARPKAAEWRRWGRWFASLSFAEGLTWGLGAFIMMAPDNLDQQLFFLVFVGVISVGSVLAFGSYLPACFLFVFPIIAPLMVFMMWRATEAVEIRYSLGAMSGLFLVVITIMARSFNANYVDALRLRFENLDLAEDLRRRNELVEQASLDKSRFLAAASHDLRQPIHALGLFVGALRATRLPAEAIRLVEQIEASAAAMDGLFSSLLDISRLDAGIVQARRQSFAIQPLLDRICRDYGEEAKAKSILLVTHPCSAIVRTDPVLMERILRNLIANAVRYTMRGRVVVGCRRRQGAIRAEIWDTGPGIPDAQQEKVFQEYFQLENPERDRAKGLGLGLAIVRRLTNLLDSELALRSQPGRGSCFSVAIPLASGAPDYGESPDERFIGAPVLGLVLVVEDEAAIRDGMASLLTSWGYGVVTAGSGDEMLAELAQCPDRPALIICDYRLRASENGIEVIERLRSEYNEAIPAMLITGDTAEDRLKEAQASGLPLLHKPVSNSKLRAAIANLIAASGADDGAEEAQTSSVK